MTAENPIVFVSSFYREKEGYSDRWHSPLWQLRQRLAALNADASFRDNLPAQAPRLITWVAEKAEPHLSSQESLAIVDRLVEVLRSSDHYVCILADRRAGAGDHGSPVQANAKDTAVSYFEIELYAATMYQKPVSLYLLEGFSPGPRLQAVLHLFKNAIPDWRPLKPQRADDIFRSIQSEIREHILAQHEQAIPLRKLLVRDLYRARTGPLRSLTPDLLFLDGFFEQRSLPDKERVHELIREYKQQANFQKRLNRLWLAVRELMSAVYLPHEVQADSRLREFLPLWDCVLGDWAAAASWHGWHGHLYAGTIAPLNSQRVIRSQHFQNTDEFQAEVQLPPDGALASAYYSIAGILVPHLDAWRCLYRAGKHVKLAIEARGSANDNLLALRGSVRLRMGNIFGAIADFERMRQLRETIGASEPKKADALMHLGHACSLVPCFSKGRDLLKESVAIYERFPNDPNLPRARRKLAFAYKMRGQRARAREQIELANLDASRIAVYDQMNR